MDKETATSAGIKLEIPPELQNEIDEIALKRPRKAVISSDLDDDQKRWLVVGICLHSVLSPALRKYVDSILLSHIALYTGFDETCDSSALLGLILNIAKFDPVIKADADNVRKYIRNPWAHCDFTEWDAVKFSNSFQLMTKLTKDLKLSTNEENLIIDEMEKWLLHGQRFLSGTTHGLELVNEFRQQTHLLAVYAALVATETDDNFMRIKHKLEKFEIIFDRIAQLDKNMKQGLLEIDKYNDKDDAFLLIPLILPQFDLEVTYPDTAPGEEENGTTPKLGLQTSVVNQMKQTMTILTKLCLPKLNQNETNQIEEPELEDVNIISNGRFPVINTEEKENIVDDANSKSTKKQTKYGVNIFRQWLLEREKNVDFEDLDITSLDATLREFYAEVRSTDGNFYSKSTFVGIRASINRHLRAPV
ncbi:unnamed protein product [Mytilus edulis]|uniref:Uncharacterized protein n=1 Tax=Mytilus edulis TaxID=6550 RepID=A0A8S3SEA4_MYTED|nr:unnamed protein product [Mytilus edulis]